MILRRSEQRRSNPYVVLTVGALAMIGAFNVVRCTKRAVCHVRKKISSVFRSDDEKGEVERYE